MALQSRCCDRVDSDRHVGKSLKAFLATDECHVPKMMAALTEKEIALAVISIDPTSGSFPLNRWWDQSSI